MVTRELLKPLKTGFLLLGAPQQLMTFGWCKSSSLSNALLSWLMLIITCALFLVPTMSLTDYVTGICESSYMRS